VISPKYLDAIQIDQILLGKKPPPPGFYCTDFKEEENSGWINYTTYRYYLEGSVHPAWCLDISGKKVFTSILFGKSVLMEVSKEEFLKHIKEISPEVMDWVLFNLDSI